MYAVSGLILYPPPYRHYPTRPTYPPPGLPYRPTRTPYPSYRRLLYYPILLLAPAPTSTGRITSTYRLTPTIYARTAGLTINNIRQSLLLLSERIDRRPLYSS